MRKISLALSPALLALVAVGCQPPPQETAPERTAAEMEADFDAVRAEWQALANADDAAAVAAFYTEDAIVIDPYGNVYSGREAITGYWERAFATLSALTIEATGYVIHGDMVATYGTYSQTVMRPEGEMPMNGMWQTVGMYQPDGSMKLSLHLTMLPAEPPPEM